MKKLAAILCLLPILLAGCSAPSADMYVNEGAYNLTPQEYIDRINEIVTAQEDSRYKEIPDFLEAGDAIEIDFIYLTVEISTDDAGKITEIYYTWDATQSDVGYSIGLYLGYTIDMLGISNSDTVFDELDMMDTSSAGYETSYSENGTLFSYSTIGHGQFNYLTIRPTSEA